jgi:methylase of polypeptide subunit release factors
MILFDLIKDSLFTHKFVLQKIVCHLTGWERDSLITHYDDEVSSELFDEIRRLYTLYSVEHEPLEYIL